MGLIIEEPEWRSMGDAHHVDGEGARSPSFAS